MYIITATQTFKGKKFNRCFIKETERQAKNLVKEMRSDVSWFDFLIKEVDSVNYNFLTFKTN